MMEIADDIETMNIFFRLINLLKKKGECIEGEVPKQYAIGDESEGWRVKWREGENRIGVTYESVPLMDMDPSNVWAPFTNEPPADRTTFLKWLRDEEST